MPGQQPMIVAANLPHKYDLFAGKRTVRGAYWGMSETGGHRSCKCGAVYDRSEHIAEAREISSFECAVCGATIENWNSAWVPRYRFIACPAREAE
jgi:stage III sporulation protein SpoIIIAA